MSSLKHLMQSAARKVGYQIQGIRFTPRQLVERYSIRELALDDIICRYMFEVKQEIAFLQIGAYDGQSTDPLRKYVERSKWSGVMLEPQPGPADRLRKLYSSNSRIQVLEAAIDSSEGTRNLYTVESDDVPVWAGGMASFDYAHLLKHDYLIPGIKEKIRTLVVKCISFKQALQCFPNGCFDLLQIDAEGADAHLLKLFPFESVKPAIVHFESKNLTKQEQEASLDRLINFGYLVNRSGGEDMLAVQPW